MNCRAAQRLLSAERDSTLGHPERADLDAHIATCSDCRHARLVVAAAINRWRGTRAEVAIPNAERAWQDLHREIRTGAPDGKPGRLTFPRWAFPLAAAAALVFAATMAPRWFGAPDPAGVNQTEIARADFVETAKDSSSMVYVDDKSGWLVVWAVNDSDKM